jgi:hypothetical protein
VTFTPTVDGTVTGYEARAYAEGTTTPVLATKWLGKPNADPVSNLIRVNIATMLNALPPANYDVIVAAFLSGGPSESAHATAYAVPLQAP